MYIYIYIYKHTHTLTHIYTHRLIRRPSRRACDSLTSIGCLLRRSQPTSKPQPYFWEEREHLFFG